MANILVVHCQSQGWCEQISCSSLSDSIPSVVDRLTQHTALQWVNGFIALAGRRMLPLCAGFLTAILPCVAYHDRQGTCLYSAVLELYWHGVTGDVVQVNVSNFRLRYWMPYLRSICSSILMYGCESHNGVRTFFSCSAASIALDWIRVLWMVLHRFSFVKEPFIDI